MKKVLVLGASGATGKLLVKRLLHKGVKVSAIVRQAESLADLNSRNESLHVVEASISEMTETELAEHLIGCEAVLSCLGHNLSFKGIYGKPRLLVTEAIKTVTKAIEQSDGDSKIKIILMNTTGNSNRDIPETPPFSQRAVISLLRLLLPPHVDNENAADFLRTYIGQHNKKIEWVAVRPDGLVDEDEVTQYSTHNSPTRNAIFDAGETSRINVADFMSELAINSELWSKWKGQMPVIYNDV